MTKNCATNRRYSRDGLDDMKSLYYDGKNVECREIPRPEPVPGETMIELLAGGIYGTDLEICRGYMGYTGVLGHEFVGRALDGPYEGMRVVGVKSTPAAVHAGNAGRGSSVIVRGAPCSASREGMERGGVEMRTLSACPQTIGRKSR